MLPIVLKGLFATDAGTCSVSRKRKPTGDFARGHGAYFAAIRSSAPVRLLRARALEAQGDHAAALEQYQTLALGYPGEEARYRYGALLKQNGRFSDARNVFRDMLTRAKHAPRYYRKKEKGWLDSAQRELASLGPG